MTFFNKLFDISDDNYYGVSGLTSELNVIYIYNTFIQKKKNILVIVNFLYEANGIYQRNRRNNCNNTSITTMFLLF